MAFLQEEMGTNRYQHHCAATEAPILKPTQRFINCYINSTQCQELASLSNVALCLTPCQNSATELEV